MRDIASTIKEREQAFEAQYKLNEEQNFKIRARRDRLFGQWVAEKLGLQGETARNYAIKLAQLDLDMPGDDNMLSKVMVDFNDAGRHVSEDDIAEALSVATTRAQAHMLETFPQALDRDHHV